MDVNENPERKKKKKKKVINILGYCVSHSLIKLDHERLQALMDLPLLSSPKNLQCTIGIFAYYSKWIHKFSDKIKQN